MVDIHPRRAPRAGTQSLAEMTLYKCFHQLSDDYTVVHSVQWRIYQPSMGQSQGEADFVVVHATRGILVIEVKGGQFDDDAALNRAHQAQRQALNFIATFQEWLQTDQLLSQHRWPAIGYGVWLPEIDWQPDADDPLASLTLNRLALADLEGALNHLFDQLPATIPLTAAHRQMLGQRLNAPRGIHPLLTDRLRANRSTFQAFSAEQHATLAQLLTTECTLVSGGAGTGKTVLAFQTALQLHDAGQRVLLLCFNQIQAQWLRGTLLDGITRIPPPFTVLDLRGLAEWIDERAGTKARQTAGIDIGLAQTQQRLLRQMKFAIDRLAERGDIQALKFDAILIDEAQDIIDDLIVFLQRRLWSDREDHHFSLFYDPAQRTDLQGNLKADLGPGSLALTLRRNYRNTRPVYALMQQFNPQLRAEPFPDDGPAGREVEYVDVHKIYPDTAVEAGERRAMRHLLQHLIEEEGVSPSDILVITCYGRTKSYWLREAAHRDLAGYHLRPLTQGTRADQVKLATIRSAKGYESDIVILAELDGLKLTTHSAQLVYTAISRARQHLVILGRDIDLRISELRRLFNDWLGPAQGADEME